jgi:hypothetical protein
MSSTHRNNGFRVVLWRSPKNKTSYLFGAAAADTDTDTDFTTDVKINMDDTIGTIKTKIHHVIRNTIIANEADPIHTSDPKTNMYLWADVTPMNLE